MRRFPSLVAAFLALVAPLAGASPLAEAPSAYVRAHAGSPVQFLTWGEAAWARAKAEQKPLYLVVGSFTQELARAMREQSFMREENAALLNESFIPVVVDRDEHPDLAAFLQAYVGTVKQMQGWPLNVWLTPELKPFEGASYLPPSDEWGKEGFPNALKRVLNAWQTDPEAQRAKADEALAALAEAVPAGPAPAVDAAAVHTLLDEAAAAWLATYDATNGGFGDPPRRLEAELLRFLLSRQDQAARDAALATLRAIAASPVRDPLDGGFFRSAGDTAWRQPTLQKVLGDQARVALAFLDAGMREPVPGALAYVASLGTPATGYCAGEDGTAEAVVPSYLWTAAEVRATVGDDAAAKLLGLLGMSDAGNLPPDAYLGIDSAGKNLPRLDLTGLKKDDLAAVEAGARAMRAARAKRPAPARDSLAPNGTHGVLLAALVRAGDKASLADATALAASLRKQITSDGLLRSVPVFSTTAGPRDYALVADGLLAFAAATKDEPARRDALALLAKADALFWNAAAGRYMAAPATLAPGIAVRVAAPASDAGDLASAETAMLATLVRHGVGGAAHRAALAAVIAADIRESAALARGDQLLALQAWAAALK
jgi:uncharacterized protein YyaL (SSP411 family)